MSPTKTFIPTPIYTTFGNGLKVVYLETKSDPISACHLFLPTGAGSEPGTAEGESTLIWSLFNKGTTSRTARQFAEDTEDIGAHMGAGCTLDYSQVSCQSIAEFFPGALELMAEALLNPRWEPHEFEKEKTALQASIRSRKDQIFTVGMEELNRTLYAGHPYHRPASGQEATVAGLSIENLKGRYNYLRNPKGAVLAIASIHRFEELRPKLETLFGPNAWPDSGNLAPLLSETPIPDNQRVQKPSQFEQAFYICGFPAPKIGTDDFASLKLLSALLGGGMSSRLFQSLREKKGLAYDVGSFYPSRQCGSALIIYIGLAEEKLEEAKKGIQEELERLQNRKVSKLELNQTKNYIKGNYILDHQTNSQRAYYLGFWDCMQLGAEFDWEFTKKLDAVTELQLQNVAKKILDGPKIQVEIHSKKSS